MHSMLDDYLQLEYTVIILSFSTSHPSTDAVVVKHLVCCQTFLCCHTYCLLSNISFVVRHLQVSLAITKSFRSHPFPILSILNLQFSAFPSSVQRNNVARLSALGPVPCHCTLTVSPVTVKPSLIRWSQQSVTVSESSQQHTLTHYVLLSAMYLVIVF